MKANETQGLIKKVLKEWLPKDANPAVWDASKQIHAAYLADAKEQVKKATEAIETKSKESARSGVSSKIQEFMENPMSPEDENKALRAILHAGLATGEIPAPLLEKIDKIIGINSGEDEKIEMVDFSTAFPDLASSIEACTKPQP